MNWFTDYESELREVFAEAERSIAAFPSPLNERGLSYLNKFHPYREGSTKNYICYLLPYWLKDWNEGDEEVCREMALAGVFVMLHFFVQDDCMDTAPPEWKEQLALAHLFQLQFLELYRRKFTSDSPFWSYYQQYMTEWAAGVTGENDGDELFGNELLIAHKASPVKLASTGVLLLSGRSALIPQVTEMVDQVLVTLQMSDDCADWEEDLRLGSANSLLAFFRKEQRSGGSSQLTESEIRTFLYVKGGLSRFAELAAYRHQRMLAREWTAPHINDFHHFLVTGLSRIAWNIEEKKKRLLAGGFSYWAYTSSNNG